MAHKIKTAFIAVVFSCWALYLRTKELAGRELWIDELNQLNNTVGPFKPVWQRLNLAELTCFPGDYLLTYPFAQIFPDNKWGLAIPHIAATILGFYFLYLICRKHLKTVWAWLIAFSVVCLNRSLVFHSFELRPYAVLPTIALAAFYCTDLIVNDYKNLNGWQRVVIGIFFVAATIYHAYGLPIIFFCMLYFVLAKSPLPGLKETIASFQPFLWKFAIVSIPIFLWYASGNPGFNYADSQARNINTFDYIPNPLAPGQFNDFFETIFNHMMGFKKYKFKLLFYGIPLAFLLPHKDRMKQIGFYLVLIVLPIQLMLLGDLHKGYWFLQRQFIWVMALNAFFMAWCWDAIILWTGGQIRARLK